MAVISIFNLCSQNVFTYLLTAAVHYQYHAHHYR